MCMQAWEKYHRDHKFMLFLSMGIPACSRPVAQAELQRCGTSLESISAHAPVLCNALCGTCITKWFVAHVLQVQHIPIKGNGLNIIDHIMYVKHLQQHGAFMDTAAVRWLVPTTMKSILIQLCSVCSRQKSQNSEKPNGVNADPDGHSPISYSPWTGLKVVRHLHQAWY